MNYSEKGLRLTKQFEGFSAKAYQCPAGIWTIGYGHTKGVRKGDTCTEEEATGYLLDDVQEAVTAVEKYVQVPLSQGQFDALVDFVFNLGVGNFFKSTLLKKVNMQDYRGAAFEFEKWNKAGGKVLAGLTKRRLAERQLFEEG